MLVIRSHCFPYPSALYLNFWEVVILIAIFSQRCRIIEWMVALPKLMYCFFSSAKASSPTPYRRRSFPASCAPRYSVYAVCISLCCAVICSQCAALTPAARAAAAYAPGLTRAAYTHVRSVMTMRYFSSGTTHARYPYCSPLAKWVDFSMVKAPLSSFSRVLMDSGVMIPVIFVMASFWATSISYTPFLDDFDDILATLLMEM
jgi:hypothetical protein